jgi:hypothetical protein
METFSNVVSPGDMEHVILASLLYTRIVEIHISNLGGVIIYPDGEVSWGSSFSSGEYFKSTANRPWPSHCNIYFVTIHDCLPNPYADIYSYGILEGRNQQNEGVYVGGYC